MKKILILGDSFAKGIYYNDNLNRYSIYKDNPLTKWALENNYTIDNFSAFGATTTYILKKIEYILNNLNDYDLILLSVGNNDCNFNWQYVANNKSKEHFPVIPIGDYKIYYERLIEQCYKLNKNIMLFSLIPLNSKDYYNYIVNCYNDKNQNILYFLGSHNMIYRYHEMYNQVIIELKNKYQLPLIDVRTFLLKRNDYHTLTSSDGIHLNKKGYDRVYSFITVYLDSIFRQANH